MHDVLACITAYQDRSAVGRLAGLVGRQSAPCDLVVYDNTVPPLGGLGVATTAPGRNGGTAASLAWALHEADRRGYRFLWMLDQDSEPHPDCLKALRAGLERGTGWTGAGATAPLAYDARRDTAINPARWTVEGFQQVADADRRGTVSGAILSGLLVRMDIVRTVNLPSASLFVDWVDYAFCAELERTGYPCLVVPEARLGHALGGNLIRRSWRGRDVVAADYPAWRVAASHRNRVWVEASIARRRGGPVAGIVRARLRDAVNGAHFLWGSDIRNAAAKAAAALAGFASGLARVGAGVSCYRPETGVSIPS